MDLARICNLFLPSPFVSSNFTWFVSLSEPSRTCYLAVTIKADDSEIPRVVVRWIRINVVDLNILPFQSASAASVVGPKENLLFNRR